MAGISMFLGARNPAAGCAEVALAPFVLAQPELVEGGRGIAAGLVASAPGSVG